MSLTAQTVSGTDPFDESLRGLQHVQQPTQAGVWEYAGQMADHQARHGWDVHLAAPRSVSDPVTWHHWSAVRSPAKGLVRESRELKKIVGHVQPDVVVAHSAKAGLIVRATIRNSLPIVFIPHAWSFHAVTGAEAVAARLWEKLAARWTNAVVCVSEGEAQSGQAAAVRAPYFLLLNPVLPRWSRGDRDPSATPSDTDVVFVGRFTRQKGTDVLLAAWPEVRRQVPDARLVLVGDGPDASALREAAGPGVDFVGEVDDPRPFVDSARIAVQPSRWEGLSLSLLEEMWSGLSVVTTEAAGGELITESQGGKVTAIDDADAVAAAIIQRLRDSELTSKEGRRNAEYVRRFHDFDTAAYRLAAVISRSYAFGRPMRKYRPARRVGTSQRHPMSEEGK